MKFDIYGNSPHKLSSAKILLWLLVLIFLVSGVPECWWGREFGASIFEVFRGIFPNFDSKLKILVEDGMAIIEDYVQCILMDPHFEFLKEQKASSSTKTSDSQADLTSAEKKETSSADDSGYKAQKEDNMSSILVLDSLQVSMRKGTFDARSREVGLLRLKCSRKKKGLYQFCVDYLFSSSPILFNQSNKKEHITKIKVTSNNCSVKRKFQHIHSEVLITSLGVFVAICFWYRRARTS